MWWRPGNAEWWLEKELLRFGLVVLLGYFPGLFCQMLNDEVICFVMRKKFSHGAFYGYFISESLGSLRVNDFAYADEMGLLLWVLTSLGSYLGGCIVIKIPANSFIIDIFKGFHQEEKIRYIIVIHNYLCMLQTCCLLRSHRDTLCI